MTQAFNLALLANNVNSSGQLSSAGLQAGAAIANLGSPTANAVLLGNGSSNPLTVAPGSSGNVLTSNGTTWTSSGAPNIQQGCQVFATAGTFTFTVPTSITVVRVRVFGGGSSGITSYGYYPGGGGFVEAVITGLTPGASITVTVGAGGASTSSSISGNAGGTSSFGSYATATGGSPPTQASGPGKQGTGSTTGTVIIKTTGSSWDSQYPTPAGYGFMAIGGGQQGQTGSYNCTTSSGGGGGMSGGQGGAGGAPGGYAYGAGSNGATGNATYNCGAGGAGGVIVFW